MKGKTTIGIFCAILLALVAFVFVDFFYLQERNKIVQPKLIMPVSENDSLHSDDNTSDDGGEATLTSFVPLLPSETLISTLTIDFDGDSYDDQIVAVRRAGSQYIFLIVGLYSAENNSYERKTEIPTPISRIRTFSYNAVDMIGNHKMALVYQGIKTNGDSVMQMFLCKKRGASVEVNKIGDFSSDGTIFIQQIERSEAYDLSQVWGAPYTVWVYSSDTAEGKGAHSSEVSQIQTEYRWDASKEYYVQSRQLRIEGSRMAAKELSRIQNGTIETFAQFLDGLWYKTAAVDAIPSYIYFNYNDKEVIFLSEDTEGVYAWEDSSLRRSGMYLTTVNTIISSIKRRFDIMVTGVNEISIQVHDNIGMTIRENNQWDGIYKKMSFQSTFGEEKVKLAHTEYIERLSENGPWFDADGNKYAFSKNIYEITGNVEETGFFVSQTVGEYPVIQFRPSGKDSVLCPAYALFFETTKITIPAKNRRSEPTVETVVNNDTIYFSPVTFSPQTCYATEGKMLVLSRKNQIDEVNENKEQ